MSCIVSWKARPLDHFNHFSFLLWNTTKSVPLIPPLIVHSSICTPFPSFTFSTLLPRSALIYLFLKKFWKVEKITLKKSFGLNVKGRESKWERTRIHRLSSACFMTTTRRSRTLNQPWPAPVSTHASTLSFWGTHIFFSAFAHKQQTQSFLASAHCETSPKNTHAGSGWEFFIFKFTSAVKLVTLHTI